MVDNTNADGGQDQGADGASGTAQDEKPTAPWFGEIGDDLKPVADEFKTPAEALKALAEARAKTADGNWRDSIADEKLRAVADRYGSPTDLVKGLNDFRAQASQRVKVPGEDATDEEKAVYAKAIGASDKVEDYREAVNAVLEPLAAAENFEVTDADEAVVDMALEAGKNAGVPTKAMAGLVATFLKQNSELREQAIAEVRKFRTEKEAELRREWSGDEFDANLALSNRAVSSLGDQLGVPELGAFLESTKIDDGGMLGDHPLIAKLFAGLGRRTGEGSLTIPGNAEEAQAVQDEIDELNAKIPPGTAAYLNPAHQRKMQALYEKKAGNAPIVGSQGREA